MKTQNFIYFAFKLALRKPENKELSSLAQGFMNSDQRQLRSWARSTQFWA